MVWAGAIVMGAGIVVLALDVEGLNTGWFLFAWIGFLLVVDGLIGRSGAPRFTVERRREAVALCVWSVPFWCIFEGYNLVIDNWTYVFLPRNAWIQSVYAAVAFATVLPACFFPAALLEAWGVSPKGPRVPVRGFVETFVFGFGLACIVLPFVWPRACFWMVWGALLGVPAVINYRWGHPSLLADLERGDWGRLIRLLAGGAFAGGMWEGMNYWARTKWVYTVPGFEEWKLFEMPLLGFVGFPFLALEAFAAYSLWCALARGGRSWERADSEQRRVGSVWVQVVALLVFSAAAERWPMDPAVLSRRPVLEDIDGLDGPARAALREQGIRTPEQLVRFGTAPEAAMAHATMSLHKGMGAEHARIVLQEVSGFEALAVAEPDSLQRRLATRARAARVRPPTLAQVKVWIRAATPGGRR